MSWKVFLLIGLVLLIGSASAMSINFFYSDTCPHCQKVKPLVQEMFQKYPEKIFRFYDVAKGSYNIGGVPYIEIDTCDGRTISLRGSQEITKYFECELQEMSTPECITYSSENKLGETYSWFIK